MLQSNPEKLIASRLCYERVKMRDQTKHYQRLLEVRPTLDFGNSTSIKKQNKSFTTNNQSQTLIHLQAASSSLAKNRKTLELSNCSPIGMKTNSQINGGFPTLTSKKERLMVERDQDIQRGNHMMLRKLLEIDHGRSDLNKRSIEPLSFKVQRKKKRAQQQSQLNAMSQHPQLQMNLRSRIDELREVAQTNMILMKKLNEAKPSIDSYQIESDQKKKIKLSKEISRNGSKFMKHPFFVQDNPAASLYRNLVNNGGLQSKKQIINRSIREHFQNIMNGTFQTYNDVKSCKSVGINFRNYSINNCNASRAQTSLTKNSDYSHNPNIYLQRIKKREKNIGQSQDRIKPKSFIISANDDYNLQPAQMFKTMYGNFQSSKNATNLMEDSQLADNISSRYQLIQDYDEQINTLECSSKLPNPYQETINESNIPSSVTR